MNQSTFISGWYAILPSHILKNKPMPLKRFGIDLVLWRQNNHQLSIFLDRCPHRGAKLSLGKVHDDHIQCPFHGFRFDSQGQCAFAPEFNKPIPGLQARCFEAKEAFDMIWIYWGEGAPQPFEYQALSDIHTQFKTYSTIQKIWHSHMTYCIENQLDYTHLRFVHKSTIGRGFKMPENPKVVTGDQKISIYFNNQDVPATTFLFTNAWILNISQKMKLVLYFCPIDATQTQLYLYSYRQFLSQPIIKKIVDPLINLSNRIILKQDQHVVASQGTLPSYLAEEDRLMRHDQAIRDFRQIWIEKLINERIEPDMQNEYHAQFLRQ
ncbi:MAG: aromatic ring-hydroxylating dioxygenase subunit alpha [Gammaproteobacteria bacterium]|nr:aromatic ring-hydroxylating dioxygenase subunit alpha [Gammaproteobacteria bacterium]